MHKDLRKTPQLTQVRDVRQVREGSWRHQGKSAIWREGTERDGQGSPRSPNAKCPGHNMESLWLSKSGFNSLAKMTSVPVSPTHDVGEASCWPGHKCGRLGSPPQTRAAWVDTTNSSIISGCLQTDICWGKLTRHLFKNLSSKRRHRQSHKATTGFIHSRRFPWVARTTGQMRWEPLPRPRHWDPARQRSQLHSQGAHCPVGEMGT